MMTLFLSLITGLFICNICWAEKKPPKKSEDIRKLLKVSGILEQLEYMKNDLERVLSAEVKISYQKIPKRFWSEFEEVVVGDQEMNALIDKITPAYDRSMDHKTIKKLIEMFDNPFWEKWKTEMPAISVDAKNLGRNWILEMSEEPVVHKRIKLLIEKYDLDKLNRKQRVE